MTASNLITPVTEEQIARWEHALGYKRNVFMPRIPHEKQHAFLWLDCLEALFGGAAGGGKSDALLLAALQYVDVPRYAAILFRKTLADLKLPGALMARSKQWGLEKRGAKFNENDKQWKFPSGASLSFGYMKNDEDRYRYQSAEFQFIGFDELTQFSRMQYTYMFSRCRRPSDLSKGDPLARVPLRVRAASNPGGRGHEWVKRRFITKVDSPPADPTQRVFIPSRLEDNPSIDANTYKQALDELDDKTRAQLLDGDWDAREPGNWVIPDHSWIDASVELAREWASSGQIPAEPYGGQVVIGIDWGEHTQAYTGWPLEQGGMYIPPSETVAKYTDPGTTTPKILFEAQKFGFPIGDVRYDAAGIQSMRTFAATAREMPGLRRLHITKIPFGNYKRETIKYIRVLLKRVAMGHTTRILLIHPDNHELIRQLKAWERKDEESEETTKVDDHGPDALITIMAPVAKANRNYMADLLKRAQESKEKVSN